MKIASRIHRRPFPVSVVAVTISPQFIPSRVPGGGTRPRRSRRLLRIACATACFAVGSVMIQATPADAGSLVVPAWAFARGNALIHASPDPLADAAPVISSGPGQP